MKGFTFPYKQKTVFVETEQKTKTKNLAIKILNKMQLPDGRADELLYWLTKAEIEYDTLSNGMPWYRVKGKGFHEFGPAEELIYIKL